MYDGHCIEDSVSQIVLVLLSTGDAYLVDQRKQYRSRVELCEIQEESEDEGQSSRQRYAICELRDVMCMSHGHALGQS